MFLKFCQSKLYTKHLVIAITILMWLIPNVRADELLQPEVTTNVTTQKLVRANKYMVATSNPYAAKVGLAILRAGGNAIDAMIAVQLVLTLVEPQSSGLGGGGFVLYYDAKNAKLTSYDGREVAPQNIPLQAFQDKKGEALPFCTAVKSGHAIGVPGIPLLLEQLHKRHGFLPWSSLIEPAKKLAAEGFTVSPRLSKLINTGCVKSQELPASAKKYLLLDDEPIVAGEKLVNTELAKTLNLYSQYGARIFYSGELAHEIVKAVTKAGGMMQLEDLANYNIVERKPVCCFYNDYKVCSMGPPSSGAITLCQILGMLQHYKLEFRAKKDPLNWHWFIEAHKLSYADRARYIADPAFVTVPMTLLEPAYLAARQSLINSNVAALMPVAAGEITGMTAYAADFGHEYDATSHTAIIDAAGNAVSFTSSIEHAFGSQIFTNGFFLNNQLTDFAFVAAKKDKIVANSIAPKKRPRSSMAPTIVFNKDDKVEIITGSAGGARIISYVAKALMQMLAFEQDIQTAISSPNLTCNNIVTKAEPSFADDLLQELKRKGHDIVKDDLNSGLQGIQITSQGILAGADPRREGVCLGD